MKAEDQRRKAREFPRLFGDFEVPTYEQWKAEVERLLKGVPFEKKMRTTTPEGITLEPIYRREDLAGLAHLESLPGGNGARGSRLLGYRDQSWEVAQEVFGKNAGEVNGQLLEGLMRGQTAITLVADVATRLGKKTEAIGPMESWVCGVSLRTLEAMEQCLAGVDPVAAPIYLRMGRAAPAVGALYRAFLEKRGIAMSQLRGSIGYDPLGDGLLEGQIPSTEQWGSHLGELVKLFGGEATRLRLCRADGLVYRDAGADLVTEMAMVLGTAEAYLSQLISSGLSVREAAGKIELVLGLGSNFLMEIAKLRAVRLVWGQILEAWEMGASEAAVHLSVRTTLYNKTRRDPYVNLLRLTTETLAGVLGGADTIVTGHFDEVSRTPDAFSRRLSRNLQLILGEECELTKVIDPAGGSWYLEKLTDSLGRASYEQFKRLSDDGGLEAVLRSGKIQAMVAQTDQEARQRLGQRRSSLVGTNVYPNLSEPVLARDESGGETLAVQRVPSSQTDPVKTLEEAKEAFLGGADLGEVCGDLGLEEGLIAVPALQCKRLGRDYEALRDAAEAYREERGTLPRLALVTMGKLKDHKLRADFSRAFFEAGGFEVLQPEEVVEAAGAALWLKKTGARIAVLCGSDGQYEELFESFAGAIKESDGGIWLVLAGHPGDREAAYREAGLDDYIFVKSDHYETNLRLLRLAGVGV
ncbi:MAG: methylmalonyl-CoA mutase family protein [Puniceicoccaceae bacterium]